MKMLLKWKQQNRGVKMKLLDKIKNAIFEEEEENEEIEAQETEPIKIKKEEKVFADDEVVKKIDVEKTIPKKIELPKVEETIDIPKPKPVMPKRERRKTPVIFDESDFIMEDELEAIRTRELPKIEKEEPKKTLYGGYKDDKPKEKFKPSPILSPVYGFVGVSPVLEQPRNDDVSSFNEMFAKEKKEEVTLEDVRQKAYGVGSSKKENEDDDLGLLYDVKKDEAPAIAKITLGDAEEYFDDLGLEYNVDYKDEAKEQSMLRNKNNVKEETIDLLESTKELEITKEQMKPKTAKEIKRVKKITDADLENDVDDEPDEKNLYDLIDMMYESKE